MKKSKVFKNGLKLIAEDIQGLFSVSIGVMVKTGSVNESESENGISHFIEHTVFKGTDKRSAFEISDYVDRIGAQINAYTSKETTCYYTKSTADHLEDALEILSDIFFNAQFKKEELDRERGVIIEEINMSEDSPEDLCLDLLSESFNGKNGLGRTILGSIKNVRRFSKTDIEKYMDKYYCADNVVVSVAGKVDIKLAEELVDKYFAQKFTRLKSAKQVTEGKHYNGNLNRVKQIEQSHISFALPSVSLADKNLDTLNLANIVFGGGMSSRLFQKVREELGLAYSVYSCLSTYKADGDIEIYAGVNTQCRDKAVTAILNELENFGKNGITEQEFLRGKEQLKSSLIMSRESTASQMILNAKTFLFLDEEFNMEKHIKDIENITLDSTNAVIKKYFTTNLIACATVGPKRTKLKI